MTQRFGIEFLKTVLAEQDEAEGNRPHLRHTEATGRTFDDHLIEEWEAVFEVDGEFYSVIYRKSSGYYYSETGEETDPFGYLGWPEPEEIECQKMVARQKTITVYEPAKE